MATLDISKLIGLTIAAIAVKGIEYLIQEEIKRSLEKVEN